MTAPSNLFAPDADISKPVTMFGPDFPFAFDDWIKHPKGLGSVPAHKHGSEVAVGRRRHGGDDGGLRADADGTEARRL